MSRSVYYPTDVRNVLLAAEQAVNAATNAAGDPDDPFTAGFVSGYRAALTTIALAFGLPAAQQAGLVGQLPDHSQPPLSRRLPPHFRGGRPGESGGAGAGTRRRALLRRPQMIQPYHAQHAAAIWTAELEAMRWLDWRVANERSAARRFGLYVERLALDSFTPEIQRRLADLGVALLPGANEVAPLPDATAAVWVSLKATPRHANVTCTRCHTTPSQAPGPSWRRCGTHPQTWQHLCPSCAAKGA